MSEQDQQVPATPAGTPVEVPAAGSQPDTKTDSQAPAAAGEPTTPAPKPDEGQPGAGEQPQTPKPEPASPPRSRRSAQYRIEQLARENAELRKQAGTPPADPGEPPQPDDDPNPTTPDVDSRLKHVERASSLVLKQAQISEDTAEISEFFSGDRASERAVYEPQIRAMWEKPQYKDLSVADAYALAAGKSLPDQIAKAKLEAVEAYKKAEKEAKESSTGGSNSSANRTGRAGTLPSDEEILAKNEKVKAGQA